MNSLRRLLAPLVFVLTLVALSVSLSTPASAAEAPSPVSTTSQTTPGVVQAAEVDSCSVEGAATPAVLPAWRWSSIEIDYEADGITGAIKQFPSLIAGLSLGIAQFMWNILLAITRFALDSNAIVCLAAPSINAGAAAIGGRIGLFIGLFAAIVIWRVSRSLMGGRVQEAIRSAGVFTLLIALMLTITVSSKNAADSGAGVAAKGTLPWMANTVANQASKISGDLFTLTDLTRITSVDKKLSTSSSKEGNSPTCEAYISALHQQYLASDARTKTLVAVSGLWEQTQYQAWKSVMFGAPVNGVDIPSRVMCHWAESANDISPTEQQLFASTIAGYEGIVKPSADGTRNRVLAFGPYSDDDRRRAMTAWAVCAWDGKAWKTRSEWYGVWATSESKDMFGTKRCNWMLGPDGKFGDKALTLGSFVPGGSLSPVGVAGDVVKGVLDNVTLIGGDDPFNLFGSSFSNAFENDGQTPAQRDKIASAKAYASSFNGYNTSDRLAGGILAIVVSLMFLYAFGALALGAFIAQVMLVALLLLSPVILLLYAFGVPRASGLLKLIGTTMVSQAFFTVLLTLVVALTGVFQNITGSLTSGFLRALIAGVSPLVALYVVKRILSSFGMANILRPTGALSFIGSAAMVATGDSRLAAKGLVNPETGKNAIQSAGSKTAGSMIRAGFAAGSALAGAGQWLGAARNGQLDDLREANRQVRTSELKARLAHLASGTNDRIDNGETDRVNRLRNWFSDNAVAAGEENPNSPFAKAMLFAAEMGERSLGGMSPEVAGALGVGQAARDGRFPELGGDESGSDDFGLRDPETAPASVIRAMNRIDDARLEASIRSAGGDEEKVASLTSDAAAGVLYAAGRQSLGPDAPKVLTPLEHAGLQAHLMSTRSGQWYATTTGAVMGDTIGMTHKEMVNNPGVTVDMMRDPVNWLSDDVRAIRRGETKEECAQRLLLTVKQQGYMDASGRRVDMLQHLNLSEDDMADMLDGSDDKRFKFRIRVHDSAAVARQAQAARGALKREIEVSTSAGADRSSRMYREIIDTVGTMPDLGVSVDASRAAVLAAVAPLSDFAKKLDKATRDNRPMEELDALRAEMRKVRKSFSDANEAWSKNIRELAGSVIATEHMTTALEGGLEDAEAFTSRLVEEMSAFVDGFEELDSLTNAAFAGRVEAIEEYTKRVAQMSEAGISRGSSLGGRVGDLQKQLDRLTSTTKATSRRKVIPRMPLARDVAGVLVPFPGDWSTRKDKI